MSKKVIDKDTLLINTFYDNKDDVFFAVYKNTRTGEKWHERHEKPKVPTYVLKRDIKTPDYFLECAKVDNLDRHDVSYLFRPWGVARSMGIESFSAQVKARLIRRTDIFLEKRSFGADLDIRDMYIMQYLDKFKKRDDKGKVIYTDEVPIKNVHRGYLDMEWDINESRTDKTKQPIWLIQYTDSKVNTTYVGCLINKRYKNQDKVMANLQGFVNETRQMMWDELHKLYPDHDNPKSKGYKAYCIIKDILEKMKYKIMFFDKEKDLIEAMYPFIFQKMRPDYCYIYNACADLSQLEARAEHLKLKLDKLLCVPEMLSKFVDLDYRDTTFKPSKRRHNFECASETKILDMMITYYSNRGAKEFDGYGLDATAKRETKFGKQDYSHITTEMTELHILDFWTALKYGIRDTMLMYFTDAVTDDTTSVVAKKYIVRTEFDRMFIPMTAVSNAFYHIAKRAGYILCNDINKYLKKLDKATVEKIKEIEEQVYAVIKALEAGSAISGGLCTDPNKMVAKGVEIIKGFMNHKIFNDTADIDAASMYPNNIITGNVSKTALFGRIASVGDVQVVNENEFEKLLKMPTDDEEDEFDIDDEGAIVYKDDSASKVSKTKGQDIALSMINQNAVDIGYHLFGLPKVEEVLRLLTDDKIGDVISRNTHNEPISMSGKKIEEIHKILSKLDKTKTNKKDQEAGELASSGKYYIDSKPTSVMSYNKMLYEYGLKSGTPLTDIYNCEPCYIINKKGDTDNEQYFKNLVPKREFNPEQYKLQYKRKLSKEDIKAIDFAENTMVSIKLCGNLVLDTHKRMTPLFTNDVDVEVYDSDLGENIYFVRFVQEIPLSSIDDILVITQVMAVMDYITMDMAG
ncbi:MAG: hypothetical protein ACRC92_26535 [Peptostreptococcaceae bacterium]